jgi:hypothetical protein
MKACELGVFEDPEGVLDVDVAAPYHRLPHGMAKQRLQPAAQADRDVGNNSVARSTKARTLGVR